MILLPHLIVIVIIMSVDFSYRTVQNNYNQLVTYLESFQAITKYSGVRVIASRILHEICLLIGELAIRGTKLTLNARLGTKSNLLIDDIANRAIAIRRTLL